MTLIFIVFFFTILELPAMLILGFWFLQQVAFGYFDLANPAGGGGGVAYFAHIGGFALRPAGDQAVRQPHEGLLAAAEVPRLLTAPVPRRVARGHLRRPPE